MSESKHKTRAFVARLLGFGLVGTLVYFTAIWLVFGNALFNIESKDVGDLVSGVMSPLALYWFVLAFTFQGIEITQNRDAIYAQIKEMTVSTAQLRAQATTMAESEKSQRLEVSLHLYQAALNRLADLSGGIIFNLSDVYRVPEHERLKERGKINAVLNDLWTRYANGNKDILFGWLRGILDSQNYKKADDLIDVQHVRKHVEEVMRQFISARADAEEKLRQRDAPDFMIQHLSEGSPSKVARRLEGILRATVAPKQ